MVDGTSLSLLEAGQHRCFSVVKLGEMLLNAGMALYEKGLPKKLDAILIYCSSLNFPFKNKTKTWVYLDIASIPQQWLVKINRRPLLKR